MANITNPRPANKIPQPMKFDDGVAANEVILKGAALLVNASGHLVNAADTVAGTVRGVAQESVDATGAAAGALKCEVHTGVFRFHAHGSATPTIADLEKTVYFDDNHTVANAAGAGPRPTAGTLKHVFPNGDCAVKLANAD